MQSHTKLTAHNDYVFTYDPLTKKYKGISYDKTQKNITHTKPNFEYGYVTLYNDQLDEWINVTEYEYYSKVGKDYPSVTNVEFQVSAILDKINQLEKLIFKLNNTTDNKLRRIQEDVINSQKHTLEVMAIHFRTNHTQNEKWVEQLKSELDRFDIYNADRFIELRALILTQSQPWYKKLWLKLKK